MADEEAVTEVYTFEGEEVKDFSAQIPSTKLEAPGAWARGTLLNMNVQLRVRSVRMEETKDGMVRHHLLAIEEATVTGVLTPEQRRAAMAQEEQAELARLAALPKEIDEEPGIEDQQVSEGTGVEMEGVEHPADGTMSPEVSNEAEPEADWSDVDARDAERAAAGLQVTDVEQTETADEAQYADADATF
jgi:hypothetical protein